MSRKLIREWPLAIILAAQSVLTLPWLWRTAPFTDEALYLDSGHQLWAHWLHHAPISDYPSWFSGALVLYPPIGAAADSLGGLPTARALSLVLMLGATSAVYFTGRLLFGSISAFFGAALFGAAGLIVHYGAFATYDAPALFFLAVSTWAAAHVRGGRLRWLLLCAVSLVLSNAFKYATLAWDPVIACVLLLHSWDHGVRYATSRLALLITAVGLFEGVLLIIAGPDYIRGLTATTLSRSIRFGAYVQPYAVLWRAFALTGVIVLAALAAAVMSIVIRDPVPRTGILLTLVLASMVAPLDQARIHELTSLDKNMGFGLIFSALAAGYAVGLLVDRLPARFPFGRIICCASGAALILLVIILGREQRIQFKGPGIQAAKTIVTTISHRYVHNTYIIASGDSRMEQYYLPQIPLSAWMGVFTPDGGARAKFQGRICAGRVSLVVMRLVHGSYDHPYDYQLRSLLAHTHKYELAVKAGRGPYITQVWRLRVPAESDVCSQLIRQVAAPRRPGWRRGYDGCLGERDIRRCVKLRQCEGSVHQGRKRALSSIVCNPRVDPRRLTYRGTAWGETNSNLRRRKPRDFSELCGTKHRRPYGHRAVPPNCVRG